MESRNCVVEETNIVCEIIVDPVNDFMITLEKKALKKFRQERFFKQ